MGESGIGKNRHPVFEIIKLITIDHDAVCKPQVVVRVS
jgi:hypothetical protein